MFKNNRAAKICFTLALILILLGIFFYQELGALHDPPFASDESHYVYASYAILNGQTPYKDIFLAQPPLMYLFYTGVMSIFGVNLYVVRASSVVLLAIDMLLTFFIAKTILKKEAHQTILAVIACLFFALYPRFYGGGSQYWQFILAESVATPLILCAVLCYSKFMITTNERLKKIMLFATGLFCGLSLMTKLTMLIFIASIIFFHIAYFIRSNWGQVRINAKSLIKQLFSFLFGFISPILITMAYLSSLGVIDAFFSQTISWSNLRQSIYSNNYDWFLTSRLFFLKTFYPIFPLIAFSFLVLFVGSKLFRRNSIFLFYVLISNILGIFAILTSICNYFIYLIPLVFLIAAFGISITIARVIGFLKTSRIAHDKNVNLRKTCRKYSILIVGLIIIISSTSLLQVNWISRPPEIERIALSTSIAYFENPYTAIEYDVGVHISAITNNTDKIWTSEPGIAFFANRLIATPAQGQGYPFTGYFDSQEYRQFESFTQVVASWQNARVIVLIVGPNSTEFIPYPDQYIYPVGKDTLNSTFVLEKTFPFQTFEYQVWVRAN